ncbi:MAG: cyclodeaminase/cyclohydrolase family protein [Sinobacteraceae bacterium]|nr:cyclodeaminase/cyclohydrolase family protein [Nevskiaceae bacterium]
MSITVSGIRDRVLGEVFESLASGRSPSGSGTAVAIAMAMAAACAHKALALTHKHHRLSGDGVTAMHTLEDVIRLCFESADRDAACFSAFLSAHDRVSAEHLLDSDRRTQQLGAQLEQMLQQIAGEVAALARADISCAGRLLQAARLTQEEISAENARAVSRVFDAR